LIAFGIWAILISITRYVSLASMCAILIATCLIWIKQLDLIYLKPMTLGDDYSFIGMSFIWLMLGCLLIILRHKSNIVRMFKHTESKAFSKK
jgi:glycerol-3-phosphate acyltransferase PlsY